MEARGYSVRWKRSPTEQPSWGRAAGPVQSQTRENDPVTFGDSSDAPSDSNPLAVTVLPASDVIQRDGFELVPNGCPVR